MAEWKAWLGTVNADSLPAYVLRSTVEQARSLACSFSLYLFLRFLSQRELENVLESSRKRKRSREKKERMEIGVGIRVWQRKNKRKKKKKCMDERKEK